MKRPTFNQPCAPRHIRVLSLLFLAGFLALPLTVTAKTYLSEDFESVVLGDSVDEGVAGTSVWTKTAPDGWTIDDSGMAGFDDGLGVTEWRGWSFADRNWWATTAGGQNRDQFTRASGAVAVADPDEWDDIGSPSSVGTFNSFLSREVDIAGAGASSLTLEFDSSFRPEGAQAATVTVAYDGGDAITVLEWIVTEDNKTNEHVAIDLDNPGGASEMTLTFGMTDAGNNWFWAIDNVVVRSSALFSEDFEGVELGESVDEGNFAEDVWSGTPPEGWTADNSGVAGIDEEGVGVTEWKGWNFADKDWWATVDDQRRSEFERAEGTVAVADPDEWDDLGSPSGQGTFNAFLISPPIALDGVAPGSVTVSFDSSFRPEGSQRATLAVSYDDGEDIILIDWVAVPDNKTNENIVLGLDNPAGAASMRLKWGMTDAGNNWFWAIDNVLVTTAPLPSNVSNLEVVLNAATSEVTLTWNAAANIPDGKVEVLRDGTVIAELPLDADTYVDTPPGAGDPAGLVVDYSVRVKNGPDDFTPISKAVVVSSPTPVKVGEWNFNDGSGLALTDSVGELDGRWFVDRDFPGEAGDEPNWVDAGSFGGAVNFEGFGYFDLGTFEETAALQPEVAVTVAAWVNPLDLANWVGIFNLAYDSGSQEAGYYLGTRDGVDFHFAVTTQSGGSLHYHRAPGQFEEWQHVVGTYDGTAIHLYIDGEEATDPAPFTGPILYETSDGTNPFGAQIGVFVDNDEYYPIAATIAHVEVWNGALDANAVRALYEQGKAGIFPGTDTSFAITAISRDDERNEVSITWQSRGGKTYAVEATDSLEAEAWQELDDGIDATGDATSFTEAVAEGTAVRYYRVRQL